MLHDLRAILAQASSSDPGPWYYSGVGSRRTEDPETLALMTRFARFMAQQNWILRSGAAPGPDTAFELGAPVSKRKIYVPNASFGRRKRQEIIVPKEVNLMTWLRACSIAERHHHLGNRMTADVRDLMGRNVYQVLGDDLKSPSGFLLCDAPLPVYDGDGRVVDVDGGTGMAVRLAHRYGVPVFHLGTPEHRLHIESVLEMPTLARGAGPRP